MIVAVGMVHQESNSFNRRPTTLANLDVCEGNDLLPRWRGTGMPLGGALGVFDRADVAVVPLLAATGASGGHLESAACRHLLDRMLQRLAKVHCDAVYLDLHGALVADGLPDVTGALVQRVAAQVGPDVRIAVSLDSHANLTEALVRNVDLMVGYKTYPHEDAGPTGARAAELLVDTMRGAVRPVLAVVKIPVIQPPEKGDTRAGPLAPLVGDLLAGIEAGTILDGTLFYTQPWLDVPDHGSAVAVTVDGDPQVAARMAADTADAWWQRRAAFVPDLLPPAEAVRRAVAHRAATVMISESADAINSGAGGDNPALIRALVEHAGDAPALTFACDAAVVEQAASCSPGERVGLSFGSGGDRRFTQPYGTSMIVQRQVPGRFRLEGTLLPGLEQDMGGAVVLRAGNTHVLVSRRPVFCSEPNLYRCAGLEPADHKIVGIKSPYSFRPNFAAISTTVLTLDMKGPASPNLCGFDWRHVGRPLYPLDPDAAYAPRNWAGRVAKV